MTWLQPRLLPFYLVLTGISVGWSAPCRAQLTGLSVTTMEYTADFERLRGLKLKRQLATLKLAPKNLSPALRARHPFEPMGAFREDLPLYQSLGLVAAGELDDEASPWPYLSAAYFSDQGDGSGPVVAVFGDKRPVQEAHFMATGMAVLAQHHDLDAIAQTGDRDKQLARAAFFLGDAAFVWLSRKARPPVEAVEDHIGWAQRQLQELFRKNGRPRPSHFATRLIEARYLEGVAGVIALRATSPWQVVDEMYRRGLPRSTAQLLHPQLLIDDRQNRTIESASLDALSAFGQPARGVFGELRLRLWLETFLDHDVARRAADGWAGDVYLLYPGVRGGTPILVFLTVWDSLVETAEAEAIDFAGAAEVAFSRRFERAKQPLSEAPALSGWLDPEGGATYVERQGDMVLIVSRCPPALITSVKDQVWNSWEVGRPDLGVVGEIRPAPPDPVAPLPPPQPWYRRTPGIVALVLWLLIALPLLSYFGTRGQKTNPVSVYIFGLVATVILIVAGWLIGL